MESRACLRVDGCVVRGGRRLYCVDRLELHCRGIVALIGENGSGKTTLLKTLAGLVDGVKGVAWAARPLVYMPEEHFSPTPARVEEWLWLNGLSLRDAVRAGLPGSLAMVRIKKLSHGWRRFVELLAVTLSRARVYMLDEPFAGMDPDKVVEAWRLVRDAGERGLVVVTGHEVSAFEGLAERMIVIHGGKVELYGDW